MLYKYVTPFVLFSIVVLSALNTGYKLSFIRNPTICDISVINITNVTSETVMISDSMNNFIFATIIIDILTVLYVCGLLLLLMTIPKISKIVEYLSKPIQKYTCWFFSGVITLFKILCILIILSNIIGHDCITFPTGIIIMYTIDFVIAISYFVWIYNVIEDIRKKADERTYLLRNDIMMP